jgi:hypothetical protein
MGSSASTITEIRWLELEKVRWVTLTAVAAPASFQKVRRRMREREFAGIRSRSPRLASAIVIAKLF